MRTTLFVTIFFLCLSLETFSQTQSTSSDTLTIYATHLSSDEGNVIAKLYRESDPFPSKPFMETSVNISDGKATIVFSTISYGSYAAILCHDKNSNGKIDHNFLGIPAEPLGFSNGWKLTLFSGMPSFNKLKFDFSPQTKEFNIEIR
jgi:uncharacterized protein (DUF2141 family)